MLSFFQVKRSFECFFEQELLTARLVLSGLTVSSQEESQSET